MIDLLQELIDYEVPPGVTYAELRYHKRERLSLHVRKGELEDANSDIFAGVGVRVLQDGAWGFSSTSTLDFATLKGKLKEAQKIAKITATQKQTRVELAPVDPIEGVFRAKEKDPLRDHSIEEKIDLVLSSDKAILAANQIKSSIVSYTEFYDHKILITTDNTAVELFDTKPEFRVGAVTSRNGDMISAFDANSITGGWEMFKRKSPEAMISKVTKLAPQLLSAKHPKGGKYTVILKPSLVGLLSHEAFGHTVEADFVLAGSIAKGKLGEPVASDLVTMVDSGLEASTAGWLPVDDEGVKAQKTVIINQGILESYLHNRETAAIMGVPPTGNARAWEFDDEPIIRMRTTYIEPKDWEPDEIIADTKEGLLLSEAGGGQADSNAEFMFQVREAYLVKNGELGELLRGVSMTGNAIDVLKTVDAVGKDLTFDMGYGHCGKGQLMKVDGGGGTIRCQVLVGGQV
ncbi:MAG: TldD/PmbA family protein [Candidatus Heimdallarchaeota archaeon]